MSMTLLALALVFVMLQFFDAYTTYHDLQLPGRFEANPVMRSLFARFGIVPVLIGVKAGVSVLVALSAYNGVISSIGLAVCDAIYLAVVINNVRKSRP